MKISVVIPVRDGRPTLGACLDAVLAQLSYHYCEAAATGDVDKAVDYAVRAAARATASTAYEEAAGHYERALSALEASSAPDEQRRGDRGVHAA